MTNLPSNSNGDTGLPRWVKVLGIIFIVALVLLWVIINLIIGGSVGHIPLMP